MPIDLHAHLETCGPDFPAVLLERVLTYQLEVVADTHHPGMTQLRDETNGLLRHNRGIAVRPSRMDVEILWQHVNPRLAHVRMPQNRTTAFHCG